ncbi:Fc.00g040630.m01.CDS01 [Cosmosporella sp. VM-42]
MNKPFLVALATASAVAAANSPYIVASPAFQHILGRNPKLTVVFNESLELFHEGGIYHPPSDSLFLTTGRIQDPTINDNKEGQYLVHVTNLSSSNPQFKVLPELPLANPTSGARYLRDSVDKIAVAALGSMDHAGGLWVLDPYPPYKVTPLTTSYGDYPYNGPDDLTVLPDGSIYFTDVFYGWIEGFKPEPLLPNMIYRYDPRTNTTRAMADQFTRPNGITHSPDGEVIYVGDTGASVGDGSVDYTAQRSIYAFTAKNTPSGAHGEAGPFLTDRRVFALPLTGAADGIKTDTKGNVWGLSTDGLHVWDPSGNFLGKILIDGIGDGGNFGFAKSGEVYIAGATALFKLKVSESIAGTGVQV